MRGPTTGAYVGGNSDGNGGAAVVESSPLSHLCPLKIAHSKPVKVRIMTGDGGNREGVYPSPTADPMVGIVDTEVRRSRHSFRRADGGTIRRTPGISEIRRVCILTTAGGR